MSITGPNRETKAKSRYSEFVHCEGFAFKLNHVDSFHHEVIPEREGITTVNLRSFKQQVADPERKLFNLLMEKFYPMPLDEAC